MEDRGYFFGVMLTHERNQILDSLPRAVGARPKFKIFRPVVQSDPVLVVNGLKRQEFPAQRLLHHKPVFRDAAGLTRVGVSSVSVLINPPFAMFGLEAIPMTWIFTFVPTPVVKFAV